MKEEYSREQLWKLYKKLPEDLQEALFSEETTETTYDICEKNGVNETREVTKIIGLVLLGLLPPSGLEKVLEEELKLNAGKAKKIFGEINSFLLYPLKKPLIDLYGIDNLDFKSIASKSKKSPIKTSAAKKHSLGSDSYRELFNE